MNTRVSQIFTFKIYSMKIKNYCSQVLCTALLIHILHLIFMNNFCFWLSGLNDLINHFIIYILLTCFLSYLFFCKFCRLWCLWYCYCKSYVRYECLPFGPKRSKGLLLYGHFMARFCAFFYSHQCGWASSSSSSSKAQWGMLLWYFSFSS